MEPPRIWKKGELCRLIGSTGNRKDAVIILASQNGKSLAVEFDGFFNPSGGMGGFLGMMPLMWCDDHFESFNPRDPQSEGNATVAVEERGKLTRA